MPRNGTLAPYMTPANMHVARAKKTCNDVAKKTGKGQTSRNPQNRPTQCLTPSGYVVTGSNTDQTVQTGFKQVQTGFG